MAIPVSTGKYINGLNLKLDTPYLVAKYEGYHCTVCKGVVSSHERDLFDACIGAAFDLTCVTCWLSPHYRMSLAKAVYMDVSVAAMAKYNHQFWDIGSQCTKLLSRLKEISPFLRDIEITSMAMIYQTGCVRTQFLLRFHVPTDTYGHLNFETNYAVGDVMHAARQFIQMTWPCVTIEP